MMPMSDSGRQTSGFDPSIMIGHGFFYLLIGPIIPVFGMALYLYLIEGRLPILELLQRFSVVALFAYMLAGVPAFFAGLATSDFLQKYRSPWLLRGIGALNGGIIAGSAGIVMARGEISAFNGFAVCGAVSGCILAVVLGRWFR